MDVVIKSKETELTLKKNQIVEVLETADGMAFNLKNNLSLMYTNNFLSINSKALIKGTIDTCNSDDVTITIDFDNDRTPASIMSNSVAPASKE